MVHLIYLNFSGKNCPVTQLTMWQGCQCEIQGLFQYFPGPFRANTRAFCTCILTQQLALQDLLLRKNQASVYVFKHCYIKGTSGPVTASSSFAFLFTGKGEKLCPFQDFQGPQPKFNGLPGPGIFFYQFQDFPGFSRTVGTLGYTTFTELHHSRTSTR